MKKFLGVVSYSVAILFSVLTFAWFALAGIVTTTSNSVTNSSSSASKTVYELFSTDVDGALKTSTVFAIIAMVLAILLAIACVVAILNKLCKWKLNWLGWVVIALAVLFVTTALVAMICMIVYAADKSGTANIGSLSASVTVSCGAGLILTFVSSVLALVFAVLAKTKLCK